MFQGDVEFPILWILLAHYAAMQLRLYIHALIVPIILKFINLIHEYEVVGLMPITPITWPGFIGGHIESSGSTLPWVDRLASRSAGG